jgi:acyl-CoA dehydrogenase
MSSAPGDRRHRGSVSAFTSLVISSVDCHGSARPPVLVGGESGVIVAARGEERQVRDEMRAWGRARRGKLGTMGPFDAPGWRELVDLGLLTGSVDGIPLTHVAAGMMGAATGGLPGPALEAELACASGCLDALDALGAAGVVTSVAPGRAGRVIVGWGAVADLVVDQGDGTVLARGPLEPVDTALAMAHGALDRSAGERDPLRARRWLLGSALMVGLGNGALELACDHAKAREQFGRKLSSFQAVQFRLAETVHVLEAAELMVLDAGRRADHGDARAEVAAALAWVYAFDAGNLVEKHTHQVFGAAGFAEEMGLIRLTYQIAWLRASIGIDEALDHVDSRRARADGVPPSTVLEGFVADPATAGTTSPVTPADVTVS